MPPSSPTLNLTRLSSTSFQADLTGDPGVTHRLFYRVTGSTGSQTGPTRVGNGSVSVTGLRENGDYLVWAVSDDGTSYSLPTLATISLSASDTILAAVVRKWNSSADILSRCGRLFTNELPEKDENGNDLTFPFSRITLGKSQYQWTTEAQSYEIQMVAFTVWCVGAEAAERAEDAIHQLFDFKSLPFLTRSTVKVEPIDSSLSTQFERSRDGEVIYYVEVTFDVWASYLLT